MKSRCKLCTYMFFFAERKREEYNLVAVLKGSPADANSAYMFFSQGAEVVFLTTSSCTVNTVRLI